MTKTEVRKVLGVAGAILAVGLIIYILMEDEGKPKKVKRSPDFRPEDDYHNDITDIVTQKETPGRVIDLHPKEEAKPVVEADELVDDYIQNIPVVYEEVIPESQQKKDITIQDYVETIPEEKPTKETVSEVIQEAAKIEQETFDTSEEAQEEILNDEIAMETTPVFPLKFGQKGIEVERLQTWLFRKYGQAIAHTGVFDEATLNLVQKEFGGSEVPKHLYDKLQMGSYLGEQKVAWNDKRRKK